VAVHVPAVHQEERQTGTCQEPTPARPGPCFALGRHDLVAASSVPLFWCDRWTWRAERWKIPLVPYAKLGLNYTFWEISNGNGNVPDYKGGHGSGGTAGWQAAAGMSLLLDILDPDAARAWTWRLASTHSYVFFEWNNVDGLGLGMEQEAARGRQSVGARFMFRILVAGRARQGFGTE